MCIARLSLRPERNHWVRLPAGRLRVGLIKQHSTGGTMCAAPLNRQRAVMFAASLQETIVDAMLSWREVDQKICLPGRPARSYLRGAHMLFAVASIFLALVILSVRSWLK